MWLSGLHVPEAFLTALVQTACRKNKWPLDKSALFTKVSPSNLLTLYLLWYGRLRHLLIPP